MPIPSKQLASVTTVDENHPLIKALNAAGSNKPRIVLVYEEDDAGENLVANVFLQSKKEPRLVDLNTPVLMMGTRMKPADNEEIVQTFYPENYYSFCCSINGTPYWVP